jgi:hypothetical protein
MGLSQNTVRPRPPLFCCPRLSMPANDGCRLRLVKSRFMTGRQELKCQCFQVFQSGLAATVGVQTLAND